MGAADLLNQLKLVKSAAHATPSDRSRTSVPE